MDAEQAEEMKQSKMNQGFEMMDKVLRFTDNRYIKKITQAWKYVVSQSS